MSQNAVVSVGGMVVNPRSLWTQFGSRIAKESETDFSIIFPVSMAPVVVGDRRQGADTWVDRINRDLTIGGGMLEGYLEKIAEVTGAESTHYQWVVVSVRRVVETDGVIAITGRIRSFIKGLGMPNLVPLE